MGAAVGIDLGTTNTVVAAVRDGRAVTLADEKGLRLIPSIVTFHPDGSVLVGAGARERRLVDPAHTIYSVKRLIGRGWDSEEVQRARGHLPFELCAGEKNDTRVAVRGETYALPEISAFVLRRAKAVAEAALGEAVDRAVITVPANFNDLQRAATKMAGKLAGLDVLRILNEPTAAALAYGQSGQQSERLAVYDLGGGTFDITLLDLSGNVFEVLATAGDTALGGDDIDVLIANRIAGEILRTHRFDPRADPGEMARLRIHAERLKQELSTSEESSVTVRDLGRGDGSARGATDSLAFRITRKELERDLEPILERTFEVCRSAIATASLAPTAFDRVILVGGPTRMPILKRRVEAFFQKPAAARVNPDEVVALGAAIQAHVLDRGRRRTATPAAANLSKTATARGVAPPPPPASGGARRDAADAGARHALPHAQKARAPSLPEVPELDARGVDTPRAGAQPAALPRGARPLTFDEPSALPPARPRIEPYARFAPSEAEAADSATVARERERGATGAHGAEAAQRAEGEGTAAPLTAPLLIDVTPLSLRVETVGGFCDVLIGANTAVPCDRTRVFLTATDGQTTVAVRVAQGESNRFADNTYLGELELSGITAAARGEASIGVTFEIDADGILNVKAKDAKSGHETRARLALFGAQNEPVDVAAMMKRQAERAVV